MTTEALRATVEETVRAEMAGDLDAWVAHLAPDFVEEYPQSRERVHGPDAVRRLLAEHPTPPRLEGEPRITILGDEGAAVEIRASYGSEPWWVVSILDVRGGLVHGERAYFAPELPPAEWRASWTVPMPEEHSPREAGGHESVARDLVERYFRAQSESDLDTLTKLRHSDWVNDLPQAGERFPSPESYLEAHAHYPGGLPALKPIGLTGPEDHWVIAAAQLPLRVSGQGAHWVGEVERTYPSGEIWFDVLFMEFRDSRVIAERSYWSRPFEAPAWREGITERY
jgi:ketosteroid isomerase-like protein